MQARDEKTNRPWGALLVLTVIALVCCVGMIELARRVAMIAPRVGDIVTFSPQRAVARDVTARLEAMRPGQTNCVLDVGLMRETGGSLIVEERQPGRNPLLRVHWSGLRTSRDTANCGAAADLMLRASDLEVLAMAAGGYGVTDKRTGALALWSGQEMVMP